MVAHPYIPEKSGLPSGDRGVGAERLGLPSGVRGTAGVGWSGHCAKRAGGKATISAAPVTAESTWDACLPPVGRLDLSALRRQTVKGGWGTRDFDGW